jgi:hypothetical protein
MEQIIKLEISYILFKFFTTKSNIVAYKKNIQFDKRKIQSNSSL